MNAAVLCPGPSLPLTATPARLCVADLTVGVNRAVTYRACDWWACNDGECWGATVPLGTPRLLTSGAGRAHIAARCGVPDLLLDDLTKRYPPTSGWTLYTGTAALCLAAYLGAEYIEVYGADWRPGPDWDGVTLPGARRDAGRWDTEREVWRQLAGYLASIGVAVRRVI